MGRIGDPSAVAHVTKLFRDGSRVVQDEALRALVQMLKAGVAEDLIAGSLREIFGKGALERLLPYTRQPGSDLGKAAILLLGVLRDEDTIRPLLELAQEEELHGEVVRVLGRIAADRPDAFAALFEEDVPLYRRTIVSVAAGIGVPAFAEPLRARLLDDDGHVRAVAAAHRGDAALAVKELREAERKKHMSLVHSFAADPYLARIHGDPAFQEFVLDTARYRIEIAREQGIPPGGEAVVAAAHGALGEYEEAIALTEQALRAGGPGRERLLIMLERLRERQRAERLE